MAKVKLIQVFRKEIGTLEKAGESADGGSLWHETENDEKGRKIRETEYTRKGDPHENITFTYDEQDRVIEKKVVYGEDESTESTRYTYDDKGHVIIEELYYDDELLEKEESEYDEQGNLVQRVRSGMDDSVMEANGFTYENDKVVHQRHYDETDTLDWEIRFEYNEKGLCVREGHNKIAEGGEEIVTYQYNENGKNIRSETRDGNGNLLGYVEVERDENDRPVKYTSETIHPSAGKLINQISYDEKGNIITNEYFDVFRGNLVAQEIISYNEDGTKHQEEVYELRSESGKKNHNLLQYGYTYFAE